MYIKRHAELTVQKLSDMFGAVLVTGPRQVGKTTMLRELFANLDYVSFDDALSRMIAADTPNTFLKDNPPPVIYDEVQKAPGIFDGIKQNLDSSKKKGQFFLSGSQQLKMMSHVSESLSGRIGIMILLGLSLREKYEINDHTPFLATDEYMEKRKKKCPSIASKDVWEMIWRGSMPELEVNPSFDWSIYYGSYVSTYIERDVKDLAQVGDTIKFTRFMELMAARNGQMLNLQTVAGEVGISHPTAERWLSILTASHIVYLMRPYSNYLTKRAVKTPKLYFLDTGLAAYLSHWNSAEVLKNGAMSGAFFETFVITEVLKSYYNAGILEPPIYYYRDKDKKEIDLIIEENGRIYPYEIKQHADPSVRDLKNFDVLNRIADGFTGPGGVICLYDKPVTLRDAYRVIPIQYL